MTSPNIGKKRPSDVKQRYNSDISEIAQSRGTIEDMTATIYENTLPAVVASIPVLRQGLVKALDGSYPDEDVLSQIALTLSEALSNVIVHAYVDMEPDDIYVAARVNERELEIIVRDKGRGFLPRDDSPGLGLGVPLMKHLTRRIDFLQKGNVGTQVRMWFDLDHAVEASALPLFAVSEA